MLHFVERGAAIRDETPLDVARAAIHAPLRDATIRGAIPRVEVREHLVQGHHSACAVSLTPEDDVRPSAHADGAVPASIHVHAATGHGVPEHALVSRTRQ